MLAAAEVSSLPRSRMTLDINTPLPPRSSCLPAFITLESRSITMGLFVCLLDSSVHMSLLRNCYLLSPSGLILSEDVSVQLFSISEVTTL